MLKQNPVKKQDSKANDATAIKAAQKKDNASRGKDGQFIQVLYMQPFCFNFWVI